MERLDVFDENNEFLGYSEERKVIHEKNLWHRHASCWIMNQYGEILLEQRSSTKKKNPNMWAKIGGHVDAGETVEEAIVREVFEEIGIQIPKEQAKAIGIYKSKASKENCFSYNFVFLVKYAIEDYVLQEEEVQRVKYFKIEELEELKKQNDTNYTFCKWDDESFKGEMDLLKEYRKHKALAYNGE